MDPEPVISLIKKNLSDQGYDFTPVKKGTKISGSDGKARSFVSAVEEIIDEKGIPYGPKGLAKMLEDEYNMIYDKDHCFIQAANKALKEYSSECCDRDAAMRALKDEQEKAKTNARIKAQAEKDNDSDILSETESDSEVELHKIESESESSEDVPKRITAKRVEAKRAAPAKKVPIKKVVPARKVVKV